MVVRARTMRFVEGMEGNKRWVAHNSDRRERVKSKDWPRLRMAGDPENK